MINFNKALREVLVVVRVVEEESTGVGVVLDLYHGIGPCRAGHKPEDSKDDSYHKVLKMSLHQFQQVSQSLSLIPSWH